MAVARKNRLYNGPEKEKGKKLWKPRSAETQKNAFYVEESERKKIMMA